MQEYLAGQISVLLEFWKSITLQFKTTCIILSFLNLSKISIFKKKIKYPQDLEIFFNFKVVQNEVQKSSATSV